MCECSIVQSFLTLGDSTAVAHKAPLSLGFSRQEYWSGMPLPTTRDLPGPGIKPTSPTSAGRLFTTEPPGKHILWPTPHII